MVGLALTASQAYGRILVTQNGSRWIGAGHLAIDHASRDQLVCHALDRRKPWLDAPFGIDHRPMLLDRIDGVDGWPRTPARAQPSDDPQPAPITASHAAISSADPAASGFTGLRRGPADAQAGGATALARGANRTTRGVPADRVRVDNGSLRRLAREADRLAAVAAAGTSAAGRRVRPASTPPGAGSGRTRGPRWARAGCAVPPGLRPGRGPQRRSRPAQRPHPRGQLDRGDEGRRGVTTASAHRNAAGEHLRRAATSRDGRSSTWGAVWTFPVTARSRIGLVAHSRTRPLGDGRVQLPADPSDHLARRQRPDGLTG